MTNEELAALLTKLDGEATPGPVKVVLIGYQPEPRLVDSTEKLLAIFGNAEDPREVFDEWNGNAELFATYRNHHAAILSALRGQEGVLDLVVEWATARKAVCEPASDDYRTRLNRLSNAEDALARFARSALSVKP